MERLRPNDPLVGKTNEYLQMFAEEGLRTLCLAEHNLSEDSYKVFQHITPLGDHTSGGPHL